MSGISGTGVTYTRAFFHCTPGLGHLLYLVEMVHVQCRLKWLVSGCTSSYGYVTLYGNEAREARGLQEKEFLLIKLSGIRVLFSVAIAVSLVGMGVLTAITIFYLDSYSPITAVCILEMAFVGLPLGIQRL
ncbi:MAG: hypothetical protein ACHQT8_03575 [Chlamydiales bacterium]